MSRVISFNEIKQHKTNKSCWIVIHNNVYDVTSYLGEHPGGEDALLENAAQDATQAFEDVGHSDDAREIMKKFKIGTLPPDEMTKMDDDNTTVKELKENARDRAGFEGTTVAIYSCDHIPRIEKPEKTWRTFDGSSGSRPKPEKKSSRPKPEKKSSRPKPEKKSVYKTPSAPVIERRVQSIIVPKERDSSGRSRRGRRGPPCEAGGSRLKWAVLALAGAVVIGLVLKKYLAA